MYNWTWPKQLWASSGVKGEPNLILNANVCFEGELVGVDNPNLSNPTSSQVLAQLITCSISGLLLEYQWLITEYPNNEKSNKTKQFDWNYCIQPAEHRDLYLSSDGSVRTVFFPYDFDVVYH